MKHKISLLIISLIFPVWLLSAQEVGSGYLNFDAGSFIYFGELKEFDFIRKDVSSYNYYYDDYSGSLTSSLYFLYASAKYQYFFRRRFSFNTGIRYSHLESSIGKYRDYSNNSDYFYILLDQNGTQTDYARLKSVAYSADYIGVPVEVMFKLFNTKCFYLFVDGGVDFSVLVNRSSKMEFKSSSMDSYSGELIDKFGKPGKFNSNAYAGFGMHIGSPSSVSFNLKLNAPAMLLTSKSSLFTVTGSNAGIGFQVSLQIPLMKNKNNTTNESK